MVWRASLLIVLIAVGASGLVLDAQAGRPQREWPADLTTADTPTTSVRRVFLEIRLAEGEPVRGLTFEAPVKGSAKKVHIHYATVVTNGDLLKARVVEISGRYEVGVTLTPQGAEKMTYATSRHVGRPLAIILDGDIVAVQTVRRALGSEVAISADFTQEDATRIVAGLNKW
jgi:preprotein translocase subunit SecD